MLCLRQKVYWNLAVMNVIIWIFWVLKSTVLKFVEIREFCEILKFVKFEFSVYGCCVVSWLGRQARCWRGPSVSRGRWRSCRHSWLAWWRRLPQVRRHHSRPWRHWMTWLPRERVTTASQPTTCSASSTCLDRTMSVSCLFLKRTGYTQDRSARSVGFGYLQDNANHWPTNRKYYTVC